MSACLGKPADNRCNARGNFLQWGPREGVVFCQQHKGHEPGPHRIWDDEHTVCYEWDSRLHKSLMRKAKQGLVSYVVVR